MRVENPKNKKQILSAHSSEVKWYIWIENYLIQYLLGQENFPNVNQILLNKKKRKKDREWIGGKTADMGNQQQYKNTLNGK